jgi:C-terminal processing protease CtpA/Prc
MRVRQVVIAGFALLCCSLSLGIPAWVRAQSVTPEKAVFSAIRLWGDLRYLDPRTVGERQRLLDRYFIEFEPRIRAAADRASYLAAFDDLLFVLNDPATHINRYSSLQSKIEISQSGEVSIVTISFAGNVPASPPSVGGPFAGAAGSNAILFDLRGIGGANESTISILDELFSPDSDISTLVRGDFDLPRIRTRSYVGYPGQDSSFDGYSARFSVADPQVVHGTSWQDRRIGFLVDGNTTVSPTIVGMALAGLASIYTTDRQPMIEATSSASIDLAYGLSATYRLGDTAGIDSGDAIATPVRNVAEALSLMKQPPERLQMSHKDFQKELKDDAFGSGLLFPDEGLRMLAVARIYNVIRYFSPYVSLEHDDWDAAAERAISDELAARNGRDYLIGLMRFYAHLHDSHGAIDGYLVSHYYGARVPITLRYLHHQAVVTAIGDRGAVPSSMAVGDVIDAIDGVPIRRAMLQAETLINASTPQSADLTALSSYGAGSLLAGQLGSKITLRFHAPGSARSASATLHRTDAGSIEKRARPIYSILPGNVGYVDLDRLEPDEVDGMFAALWSTKAIVFDDRGYPRAAAWSIAPRLAAQQRVPYALFSTPVVSNPIDSLEGEMSYLPSNQQFLQILYASDATKYRKPSVMLIDARAISQSEHSALMFRAVAGTRFVGTPTAGADGDVTSMVVPSGLTLEFSGEGVSYPNGRQLQRVGIQPDRWVEPSASDIAKFNDVVLQAGLDEAMRLDGASLASRRAAVGAERTQELSLDRGRLAAAIANIRGSDDHPLQLTYRLMSAGFTTESAPKGGHSGGIAYSIRKVADADAPSRTTGLYGGTFNIGPYLGKTIRVRGYLETTDVIGGGGFLLRIDSPSRSRIDLMQDRWLRGSTAWMPFTIVLRVPLDALQGTAGVVLKGTGLVRASDVHVDVVPDSTSTTGYY